MSRQQVQSPGSRSAIVKRDRPCSSTAAGTAAASGPDRKVKCIEAIGVGDLVWAWDDDSRALVKRRVTRLFRYRGKPILQVSYAGRRGTKQLIEATSEHPFWVVDKGWVAARDLQAGDVLQRIAAGSELRVQGVVDLGRRADVYNFEVEGAHNYFVGQDGVLVHNMSSLDVHEPMPDTLRAPAFEPMPDTIRSPASAEADFSAVGDAVRPETAPGDWAQLRKLQVRVNVTDKYSDVYSPYGTKIMYGDPKAGFGNSMLVSDEGVLSFHIEAKGRFPYATSQIPSGRDMFLSGLDALGARGVEVKGLDASWWSGGQSDNYEKFASNYLVARSDGSNLTWEDAAKETWTGRIAKNVGFDDVDAIIINSSRTGNSVSAQFVSPFPSPESIQAAVESDNRAEGVRRQAELERNLNEIGDGWDTPDTIVSDAMEQKILYGARVPNSNRLIGGHSAEILSDPNYAVQVLSSNPDGTTSVKFTTQFSDGTLSKLKASTLFPSSWTGSDIINATQAVGAPENAVATRTSDRSTFYQGTVNGVNMDVIKNGYQVTSSYPTGGPLSSMASLGLVPGS